ncbi:HAF repeat-containing PEP-CTERM protein [Nitrosomonas oligotropha]|uniref:HAF repeat-containing PEP-CTERM protein n=1 Tax=Nitrosomonas oligotropha TaxID=42354 RepID=UPI00136833F6|nr:HAF repeat-containing PEP-CTERM protein [Nitrosomonas oligotropha]MXS82254.1 PEP-CTERM sorting domain-containing protein [Nitrosomonas oligotropha]
MKNNKKYVAVVAAGILSASISMPINAEWSIYGLGTLGGVYSEAARINDSGQVVGLYYTDDGKFHAFSTKANGLDIFDLGTLGGTISVANGINNLGQVAGASYIAGDEIFMEGVPTYHAFLTGNNGVGMTDLGGLLSYAMNVNNNGNVVGQAIFGSGGYTHSFITGTNGLGMIDMGTLGGNSSSGISVNDLGQVVGWSNTNINNGRLYHAFVTDADGKNMTDLGTLGGLTSFAADINNSGQVVGISQNDNDRDRAFMTAANSTSMIDLGTFGGSSSRALGINDAGQVVGNAYIPGDTSEHAFVYSDGVMVDLSLLDAVVAAGWTSLQALDINNNGQIVGIGMLGGIRQAFLLSGADQEDFFRTYVPPTYPPSIPVPEVPEPHTYAMLLAGLGLVGFRKKIF